MSTTTTCVACGAPGMRPHLKVRGDMGPEGLIPTTDRFGVALGDIVRCARCGHGQVDPMPDAATLARAYGAAASTVYVEEEAGQRETARRWLARLERHAPSRTGLLDIGCWVGYLLAEARRRGWDAVGVEPSAFAAAFARDEFDLRVISGDLFTADLNAASFSAITMNDLIEHLVEPGRALDRITSLLAPGGVLGMVLPDGGSAVARSLGRRWWSVIPTHLQYFTRASITALLGRHGFETIEMSTAPKAFTVEYYLSRIGGYVPAAGRALTAAARIAGVADRLWAPDFRDRMAVIARVARPPGVRGASGASGTPETPAA